MAAAPTGEAARALSQREQDVQMMLAADVKLGTKNCDFQPPEGYVYFRRTNGGIHIINLGKTWGGDAAALLVGIPAPTGGAGWAAAPGILLL
ncbi:unnamed protein product [Urochloa humidicola]